MVLYAYIQFNWTNHSFVAFIVLVTRYEEYKHCVFARSDLHNLKKNVGYPVCIFVANAGELYTLLWVAWSLCMLYLSSSSNISITKPLVEMSSSG